MLGFGWRGISDGLQKSASIEPVRPFQCCKLNGFELSPGSASVDHFGFVEAVDGLGESIVITISNAADRGFNSGFCQSLGIFD